MFKSGIPKRLAATKEKKANCCKGKNSANNIPVKPVTVPKVPINDATFLIEKEPINDVTFVIKKEPANNATSDKDKEQHGATFVIKNGATFVIKNGHNVSSKQLFCNFSILNHH